VIPPTWVYALEDLREARERFQAFRASSRASLLLFLKLRAYPLKRQLPAQRRPQLGVSLSKEVEGLRGELSYRRFGREIGVTAAAVCQWEKGDRVGPYNRQRLLVYAQRVGAAEWIQQRLVDVQPQIGKEEQ
jgi:hypothetical protein